MGLKTLELSVKMDGCEVSRSFRLADDESLFSQEELAEMLGDLVVRGLSDKPDIIKGMLFTLLEKVEAKRKGR